MTSAIEMKMTAHGLRNRFEGSLFFHVLVCALVAGAAGFAQESPPKEAGPNELTNNLARFDAQLAEWDLKIAKEQDPISRSYLRNGKARCAWAAAQAAVRAGAYESASKYLDVMRDFGQTWVSEAGREKGDLVRKLLADSNSIPVRIEFARGFWIANVPALGVGYAEARQILIDTLKLMPDPDQRLQLYQLIQQYSFAIPDTAAAAEYTERICAEYSANADICDQSLFALAQHYSAQGQPQKACETLRRILNLHPASRLAGLVHLGLSEILAGLKDEEGMLRHLELAAQMPPEETRRHIMDSSDTRQVALVRLGKYYQNKKNFAKALEYFRAWEPRSWCANGQAQFAYERDLYIAECLVSLGEVERALTEHLMPHLLADQGELYFDARIPELVVRLYEHKKDLDGLIRTLRPHAESQYNHAARIALGLAEIRVERRDGKIDALVQRLRHSGRFVPNLRDPRDNWEAPAAARALSEMKGKEYPALRREYERLLERKDREDTYGRQIWVLYAIALSNAPEARAFLEELLKKADEGTSRNTIGVSINDIQFVASLARGNSLEPQRAGDSR